MRIILFKFGNKKMPHTARTKHGLRMLEDNFRGSPATNIDILGLTWQFRKIAVFLGMLACTSLKL